MPDLDSEMATPPTALERAQIAHVDLLDIASAIKCGVYEERLRGLDRLQTASHAFTAHLGAALAEVDRLAADLAALRIEHEAVCGLLTHTRRERDDARDETRRLWDATEADRARMAALESRPTYEDGVREAAEAVDNCDNLISVPRTLVVAGGVYAHSDTVRNNILALLEPKT